MNLKKIPTFLIRISFSLAEFIIFVDFWLVIVVLLWGSFNYRLISIGDTYFEARNIYRLIIIFIMAGGIWRLLKFLYPNRSFGDIFKNPKIYFIAILILYNAVVIPVVLNQYYSFDIGEAQDFAHQHHAIYNTLKGNILRTDIFPQEQPFRNWNFLKVHFSPFILFIVPFYYFFQNGDFLLIIQCIAISIASIPIFLIAKQKLKNEWLALIISLSYLFYPLVIRFPFRELRQEYFAISLLLFAFYSLKKRRVWVLVLLLILAGLCKEDVLLAIASIGIYIFFFRKEIRYHRILGILIFIISVILFVFIIAYFIPVVMKSNYCGFGPLGGEKGIVEILFRPKRFFDFGSPWRINFFINLFKALGFLPLLSPFILLALPFIIQNWITDMYATTVYIWHSTLIIPYLFISLIYGISIISRFSKSLLLPATIWLISFVFFLGGDEFQNSILNPFFQSRLYINPKPGIYEEFCEAEEYISKDSSVFTHFALLPNLSNRGKIYSIGVCPTVEEVKTDYVFLSPLLLERRSTKRENLLFKEIIASSKYEIIFNSNNFIAMARKDLVNKLSYLISDFAQNVDYDKWDVNVCNVKYKSLNGGGYRLVSIYFDGDGNEDEFIQIRREGLDIDLKEYQYFTIGYNLEDSDVQTIEVVFGVDFDGDYRVDTYIKRFIPELQLEQDLWRNLFNIISEEFPDRLCYKVIQLELYPHKIYNVDCSGAKEGWYKFWLGKASFFNVLPK